MLIDTHCHLHDHEFYSKEEAEKALLNAQQNNVSRIICIGTSHSDSIEAKNFAENHEDVFWTYGIHPEHSSKENFDNVSFANFKKPPVAIGEIGLDYHYEGYDRESQIKLFEKMLQLAKDNNLPVSFHIREAFEDFFAVVSNFPEIKGVVHSFTDSKKNLKKILNSTDFYIGVNGLATYSTLPTPPIERILIETDAPFLAPIPFRGKTNEPAYVKEISEWLAEKLDLRVEEIENITTSNAENLFRLS